MSSFCFLAVPVRTVEVYLTFRMRYLGFVFLHPHTTTGLGGPKRKDRQSTENKNDTTIRLIYLSSGGTSNNLYVFESGWVEITLSETEIVLGLSQTYIPDFPLYTQYFPTLRDIIICGFGYRSTLNERSPLMFVLMFDVCHQYWYRF